VTEWKALRGGMNHRGGKNLREEEESSKASALKVVSPSDCNQRERRGLRDGDREVPGESTVAKKRVLRGRSGR